MWKKKNGKVRNDWVGERQLIKTEKTGREVKRWDDQCTSFAPDFLR